MGLSESTLHWLVDADSAVEPVASDPATAPHYDPRAAAAGRRRTIAVVGGAAIVALAIAWALHAQAERHPEPVAVPSKAAPADVLTRQAEAALAQGRASEAMDLAHLALESDARFSDAYLIVGAVQRDNGHPNEARDAYRKYLELAPLGTHAQEARTALGALPP
jgi:Flp pilus assembly protein TadD